MSISRRSPRRSAGDDASCRPSPPPLPQPSQVSVDLRPSPLHLVASDASRRSPRDGAVVFAAAAGRPGSGRPPISPRDAAAIAANADRRTTFATQKSFSYDVPSVEPPPQLHYRKQSEPIVGSRQRQVLGGVGGGVGRLLPRLPISGTQLEHHISQLMKYRGGAAAVNLSVDATGPQHLDTDLVSELKELRRSVSPSHKTGLKESQVTGPVSHPAAGTRRSPCGLDSSLVSEAQSDGRRRTFAGQKSLSYEVNQYVQYQPSGSGAERLRDYLDDNEIKEFEIEDSDGTGVSVWVPPATLSDRADATQAQRDLGGPRRTGRVGGQRRAHFAEQRSFSCETAGTPTGSGHRGSHLAPGHQADVVGRRYARESNVRLVRQSKTEAIEAVDTPSRDVVTSRRRERTTPPDAETASGGSAAYRSRHHQAPDNVVEHSVRNPATAIGYGDFDSRGSGVMSTYSSSDRYDADRNRKSTKDMRPLERHSSMACGPDEHDKDMTSASSARRHTTGQVHDYYQESVKLTKSAAESSKHYGRAPADGGSHAAAERGRALMSEVDSKTGDMVVDAQRKTSPRRANMDVGKDAERTRPPAMQAAGGHTGAYHGRRTTDLHENYRYESLHHEMDRNAHKYA